MVGHKRPRGLRHGSNLNFRKSALATHLFGGQNTLVFEFICQAVQSLLTSCRAYGYKYPLFTSVFFDLHYYYKILLNTPL